MGAIEDEVVAAAHAGDAVEWEADELVERYRDIGEQQWKEHRVDDRRSDDVAQAGAQQVLEQPGLEAALLFEHFLFEADALVFEVSVQLGAAALQLHHLEHNRQVMARYLGEDI